MSQELFQKFQQAYRNLDLVPLLSDRALAEFGGEYKQNTIAEVEFCAS